MMYKKKHGLSAWLKKIREFCDENRIPDSSVVFRIFLDIADETLLPLVLLEIRGMFPDALYAGSTSAGNIVYGSLVDSHIAISCTVYEDPGTQVRIIRLPMSFETQKESVMNLRDVLRDNPWVKAVEIMMTMGGVDMDALCQDLSELPENIMIYGGCAHAAETKWIDLSRTFVFSSDGEAVRQYAVFILLGGPELHISARYLIGWRQIGGSIPITDAEGRYIHTLGNVPAGEVYKRKLQIPEGRHYFALVNVFPLGFRTNGTPYLRIVTGIQEDGGIRLSSFIRKDTKRCAFTFGNTADIMHKLQENLAVVQEFSPQVIQMFSCAARLLFWGRGEVSRETMPFETIAHTSGFYTAGEFLRSGKDVLLHNVTNVIVAQREGEPSGSGPEARVLHEELSLQMLISECLVNFIESQTEEAERWENS